jgi:competence protein ComEA
MDTKTGDTENKSGRNLSIPTVIFTVIIFGLVGIGIFVSMRGSSETRTSSRNNTPSATNPVVEAAKPADGVLKVYVTGEVNNPGVYQLQAGDRQEDALKAAGGPTDRADLLKIDLAKRVVDEMQIIVPSKTSQPATPTPVPPVVLPTGESTTVAVVVTAAGVGKINVNTASAKELDLLPGIGEVLSARIVEYRAKIGPYRSVEDLRKIPGITGSVIEKIKDLITF